MIENSQILDHVGKTKTKNLMEEITKEYFENKKKVFPVSQNHLNPMSIVSVTPENSNEIKSIGTSCINDLLLDNFANWFQWVFLGFGSFKGFTDINSEGDNYYMCHQTQHTHNKWEVSPSQPVGSLVQVGKGSAPAQRNDFQINDKFPTGKEGTQNATGFGNYFVGLAQVQIPSSISPTTNAGVISESILMGNWKGVGGQDKNRRICLSRDNISPVVNFLGGETINIDYILQL